MDAKQTAARMGQRAGEQLRDLGIPSRNPFPQQQPDLASAWRDAYVSTATVPAVKRRSLVCYVT